MVILSYKFCILDGFPTTKNFHTRAKILKEGNWRPLFSTKPLIAVT